MTVTRSRTAAPDLDVTSAMRRGRNGSGTLRAASKSPSAASRFFSCSNASWSAPAPSGCASWTISWYLPWGG